METHSSILPGEFHRQKTPVRYSLWDHKKSGMTEQLTQTHKKIKSDLIISSVSQSCLTLCSSMDLSMPGFPVNHQLQELEQTHVHGVCNDIQPSHPLSPPSPPAFSLPRIKVFSSGSVLLIRWPKYWSLSFSISPSIEYSELISSRIDCFDILAVQGTLKHLLQHHSSKALILQLLAFFHIHT